MRKLSTVFALLVAALVVIGVAVSAPPPTTFITPLEEDQEVPGCPQAGNEARGLAVFHVVDEATGTVRYKLVANNLPGDILAAHIHVGARGVAGPVVQPLALEPGAENGVIGDGSFSNAVLLAAMQADPQAYYVNVHTNICPPGAVRGQLGEHGSPGTAE